MIDVLKKRKSDEQIEIVAYLLKNKPINTSNADEVSQVVRWLRDELEKRRFAQRHYGAKGTNKDYVYVLEQYERLTGLMKGE